MRKKEKGGLRWFFTLLALGLLAVLIFFVFTCFEGRAPEIKVLLESSSLGKKSKIGLEFCESGRGLKDIKVFYIKDGRQELLEHKVFPPSGFLGSTGIMNTKLEFLFKADSFSDGIGTLRVEARDASLRSMFKGNLAFVEKEVFLDTRAPEIAVLTRQHYLSRGGAGLVAFRVNEAVLKSGVMVDGNFFPAHEGFGPNKDISIAFFALGHKPSSGAEIFIFAEDFAGNTGRAGFPHYVNARRFAEDKIDITDRFLNWKMPEFELPKEEKSLLDKFLKINGPLRVEDEASIFAKTRDSLSELLWEKHFLPLPSAANRGGFADHRIYYYKGREIDRQFHMGIDLASIAQSPVPAAAAGRVRMVDNIGIYGQNVLIDHGCGLFTHYAHLSQIMVSVGDRLERGDIVGRTGLTGMAGGDHLHFGVIIHDFFVNPIEWLDANWVENNILSKLRDIASGIYG